MIRKTYQTIHKSMKNSRKKHKSGYFLLLFFIADVHKSKWELREFFAKRGILCGSFVVLSLKQLYFGNLQGVVDKDKHSFKRKKSIFSNLLPDFFHFVLNLIWEKSESVQFYRAHFAFHHFQLISKTENRPRINKFLKKFRISWRLNL